MKTWHVDMAQADERGSITDLLEDEIIEHVSMIATARGSVRGNHYHRETYQWLYIISGALSYAVQGMEAGAPLEEGVARAGDVLMTCPMESHALHALEDSTMVVMTRGPRGGREYESDTFRLSEPLLAGAAA